MRDVDLISQETANGQPGPGSLVGLAVSQAVLFKELPVIWVQVVEEAKCQSVGKGRQQLNSAYARAKGHNVPR